MKGMVGDAPVQPPVYGCTDIYASNYSSEANSDDGTCEGYPNLDNHSLNFSNDADYVRINASSDFDFSDDQQFTISAYVKTLDNNEVIFQAERVLDITLVPIMMVNLH